MITFQTVTTNQEIQTLASLAHEIWNAYFVPIIGQAQVDYMVGKFQSAHAIHAQIQEGYRYELILVHNDPAGYFGIQPQPTDDAMFLSKLYIKSSYRGRGLARQALGLIESLCIQQGLTRIWLTCNKNNTASIAIYQHLGFEPIENVVMDIGQGFVMDDVKMRKLVRD